VGLASLALPANQITVFTGNVPVTALADTGAAISVMDKTIFEKIKKPNVKVESSSKRCIEIYTADKSAVPIITDCETELKINGVKIPVVVAVVEKLGYDLIIGMDVLQQTQAVLDVETNTLTLYRGLTAVPMTTAGACAPVVAEIGVEIPPLSEAVFPVRAPVKLPKGDFLIEAAPENACRSLMVARTLVRAPATTYPCRVINRHIANSKLRQVPQ
jgi:predicted aspartyl protease